VSVALAKRYVIRIRHTYALSQAVYTAPQTTQLEAAGIDPIFQYIKHKSPTRVQVRIQNTGGKSALSNKRRIQHWLVTADHS